MSLSEKVYLEDALHEGTSSLLDDQSKRPSYSY